MPVPAVLETEALVFVVVALIEEGVAEAETKLKDDAANNAAVEANRMLSMFPLKLFLLFFEDAAPVDVQLVVEAIIKAEGGRCRLLTAVDKVRHDVGEEEGQEEDGGCRSGPDTLVTVDAAKAEVAVEDEVDTDVEVIVLLLSARQDDDKSADRVAVQAAQDAMILCYSSLIIPRKGRQRIL